VTMEILRCVLEGAAADPYVWFTDQSWKGKWKWDYRLCQKRIFVDKV